MNKITIKKEVSGTIKAFRENKIFDNINPDYTYKIEEENYNDVLQCALQLENIHAKSVLFRYLRTGFKETINPVEKERTNDHYPLDGVQILNGSYRNLASKFKSLFGREILMKEKRELIKRSDYYINSFIDNISSYNKIDFQSTKESGYFYDSEALHVVLNYQGDRIFKYCFLCEGKRMYFEFDVTPKANISKILSKYSGTAYRYNNRFKKSFADKVML
jgi:hypothetical protein